MYTLPVDRALSIYGALADRSETKGARERLSRHLMKLYIDGEKNEHRLTVHGLSYLKSWIVRTLPELRSVRRYPFCASRCFRSELRRMILAFATRTASFRVNFRPGTGVLVRSASFEPGIAVSNGAGIVEL